jgi:hypothetical protein
MATSETNADRPGATAWRAIEPYWDIVNIYDGAANFLESLEAVPIQVRHLLAVWWADSEICNGGFHQLFSNSTGVLAPEAAEGFRAVGLEECFRIVRAAIERFGTEYPRDRVMRDAALQTLLLPGQRRQEWDPFTLLDEEYYAARHNSAFDEHIDAYARTHAR